MAKRRRTEIAKIVDPAARLVTFSKRRTGLFKKVSDLCCLCGARAAVVVFSPAGRPYSIGDDVIADYLRGGDGDGDVMPPMGLTEWVEADWDACKTEEDLESFISKYEPVRDRACRKLEALEDASQVKVGASDLHIMSEEEINSLVERLGQCPRLSDLLNDGDSDAFRTSPGNSGAGGGSSAMESIPALSDHVVCGHNTTGGGSSGVASTPGCSDFEGWGFDPDDFLCPSEDCDMDGDGDGFLTSPEVSAVGGGNSGVEPASNGYNPSDFAGLEDLGVL